jgi:hypothetical protein
MSWNQNRILVYRQPSLANDSSQERANDSSPAKPDAIRVGLWDLDASVGALPSLLDQIESCQSRFVFQSVEAPFPTGLTRPGVAAAIDWLKYSGKKKMDAADVPFNVAARPIFEAAKPVLAKLPIDWLIVVVKSMVSDTMEPDDSIYNLFSTSLGKIVLISTYDVRKYASLADRSFEAAVFQIALAALLGAMIDGLRSQMTTTGSIFDYCKNRKDIVLSIQNPTIDADNRAKIPENILRAVDEMLDFLRTYKGGQALSNAPAKRPVAKASKSKGKRSSARAARSASPRKAKRTLPSEASAFRKNVSRGVLKTASRKATVKKAPNYAFAAKAADSFVAALQSLQSSIGGVAGKRGVGDRKSVGKRKSSQTAKLVRRLKTPREWFDD